ncbi:MAG: hypothetical protein K5790_01565 [Nitrosopumilus sp.]|uniref:hypothetical protein n=1 Tax=Nitrosopumilus sp. TaxID=2024843 RepID=UPI00247BCB59|nr:hypothetical protein [Nitrosopumilus sp.]MCV0391962.1 hypothetical protein [Nitrosopumilus sp.]
MNSLATKYSNWQIYGFFSLFISNSIWTYYALVIVKATPFQNNIVDYLYETLPFLGIYVGIPLLVSFLIGYRMYKKTMLTKKDYSVLMIMGFVVSLSAAVIETLL